MSSEYHPFSLLVSHHPRSTSFGLHVVSSPAGEAGTGDQLFNPPFTRDQLLDLIYALTYGPGPGSLNAPGRKFLPENVKNLHIQRLARQTGIRLFEGLFAGQVARLFDRSLERAEARGDGLRIELRLDPREPALSELLRYPWELMCCPGDSTPLCLSPRTPVVRHLTVDEPIFLPPAGAHPLRVLLITSSAEGQPTLAIDEEVTALREKLAGVAHVKRLPRPSWTWLRETLRAEEFEVLHFMGHGGFDEALGEGNLLMEDDEGRPCREGAPSFAAALRQHDTLRLVVLNACETGKVGNRAELNPFAGLAEALVMEGIPAVVAMQFPIPDSAALKFSRVLYERLAADEPIEAAITEARLALKETRSDSHWAAPVLYLRGRTGRLFPRNASPRVAGTRATPTRLLLNERRPPTDSSRFLGLIESRTRDFVGRETPLAALQDFLDTQPNGYLFVRGGPGAGKTSLLAKVVRNRSCVHHFDLRTEGIFGVHSRIRGLRDQLLNAYPLPLDERTRLQSKKSLDPVLSAIAKRWQAEAPILIVIDPGHEPLWSSGRPSMSQLGLPRSLPRGIYALVSLDDSLPVPEVDAPHRVVDLGRSPEDLQDLRRYILSQSSRSSIRSQIDKSGSGQGSLSLALTQTSGSNFLLLDFILHELDQGNLTKDFPAELPQSLRDFFEWKWKHLRARSGDRWTDEVLPVFLVLAKREEPMPIKDIAEVSGLENRSRLFPILNAWRPLIVVGSLSRPGAGLGLYRVAHDSVLEDLRRRLETAEGRSDALINAKRSVDARFWKFLRHRRA